MHLKAFTHLNASSMGRLFHMKYTAECHRPSVQSQDAKYIGFSFQEQQYEANGVFNNSDAWSMMSPHTKRV